VAKRYVIDAAHKIKLLLRYLSGGLLTLVDLLNATGGAVVAGGGSGGGCGDGGVGDMAADGSNNLPVVGGPNDNSPVVGKVFDSDSPVSGRSSDNNSPDSGVEWMLEVGASSSSGGSGSSSSSLLVGGTTVGRGAE